MTHQTKTRALCTLDAISKSRGQSLDDAFASSESKATKGERVKELFSRESSSNMTAGDVSKFTAKRGLEAVENPRRLPVIEGMRGLGSA